MNCKFTLCASALALAFASFGANAATRYVTPGGSGDGSSWEQASGDLQAAIDASESGDQVWIAAGSYSPTSLIKSNKPTSKAFILKDGVSLLGGFKGYETDASQRATGEKPYEMVNETIIDCNDDTPDTWTRIIDEGTTYRWTWATDNGNIPGSKSNSSHGLYCSDKFVNPTVIDGLTITGANANVSTAKPAGGAIYALGTVDIKNCKIVENQAWFSAESFTDSNTYGGAVYLDGGALSNCLISRAYAHSSYGNGVGGGVFARNASIANCTFEDCVGLDGGGAVYMIGGTLDKCDFARCYSSAGGAVYNNGGTVSNINANDCRALNGGAVFNNGTLLNLIASGCLADAVEYSTSGGKGGALYNNGGDAAGILAFNCSAWQGGGVFIAGGRVINSTVLNNASRDEESDANIYGATDENTLNTIYDATTAGSNFVSPTPFAGVPTDEQKPVLAAADWKLAPGSEFIDAGTAVDGYADGTDLAGNPRVAGNAIDMGAYEFQGDYVEIPTIVLTFAPDTESVRIGVGGASGYEFSIDWGDGNPVKYDALAYYTHDLAGSTVKIYGDEIIQLIASSQGVVAADLSRAEALTRVTMIGNGMTTLTLGNHPALTGLYASQNQITSLDLSGCPALKVIDVHQNAIESVLDLSAMANLSGVDVAENKIPALTLPKHSILYDIDCSNNQLTELDVTGLSGLTELSCSSNLLESIDLTGLTAVEEIYLDDNKLTSIDISPCTELTKIMVAENQLTDIDLSKNASLSGVYVQDNKLTALDITANPNVRWINLNNNLVLTLDVSAQKYMSILNAANNKLSSIDLSGKTNLSSLDLSGNSISEIDLSSSSYLSQCHVENNNLSTIDLSHNPYLYGFFCGNNNLTELDLTANTYLQRLEAYGNGLTSLDITKNTGLQEILLQSNNFDADALDALIQSLPDVNSVNVTPETESFLRKLDISYMPGTAEADVEAAETKGWYVTADFDQEVALTPESLNLQINSTADGFTEVYNSTIEYTDENQTMLSIKNFMETGADVKASIDGEGNIKIVPQVVGGDGTGNFYMIVNADSTDGNPMAIYNTYVAGTWDGETLTLDPWNLIIVPPYFNDNLGTAYPENITSKFVKSNGKMTYTTVNDVELTQNVYATVEENRSVSVYGWGEYAMVNLSRNGGMWAIDASAVACTVDGDEYAVATPEGDDVVSTGAPDPRTLIFGAWQLKAVGGTKVLRDITSTTLSLDFDLPAASGIDEAGIDNDVVSTVYYNAAGLSSDKPFNGFNIKVETLGNGTTRTSKTVVRQ